MRRRTKQETARKIHETFDTLKAASACANASLRGNSRRRADDRGEKRASFSRVHSTFAIHRIKELVPSPPYHFPSSLSRLAGGKEVRNGGGAEEIPQPRRSQAASSVAHISNMSAPGRYRFRSRGDERQRPDIGSRFAAGPIGERKRLTVVLRHSQASFSPPLTQRPTEPAPSVIAPEMREVARGGPSRLCCFLLRPPPCVSSAVSRGNKR